MSCFNCGIFKYQFDAFPSMLVGKADIAERLSNKNCIIVAGLVASCLLVSVPVYVPHEYSSQ